MKKAPEVRSFWINIWHSITEPSQLSAKDASLTFHISLWNILLMSSESFHVRKKLRNSGAFLSTLWENLLCIPVSKTGQSCTSSTAIFPCLKVLCRAKPVLITLLLSFTSMSHSDIQPPMMLQRHVARKSSGAPELFWYSYWFWIGILQGSLLEKSSSRSIGEERVCCGGRVDFGWGVVTWENGFFGTKCEIRTPSLQICRLQLWLDSEWY